MVALGMRHESWVRGCLHLRAEDTSLNLVTLRALVAWRSHHTPKPEALAMGEVIKRSSPWLLVSVSLLLNVLLAIKLVLLILQILFVLRPVRCRTSASPAIQMIVLANAVPVSKVAAGTGIRNLPRGCGCFLAVPRL